MGLRKSHVKKENPRAYPSGLFGMIDQAEFTTQMKNNLTGFPVALNYRARKSLRDTMLEAEYRKAQAIVLTRQMRYL